MRVGPSPRRFSSTSLLTIAAITAMPLVSSAQAPAPDSAGYVTRLGTDTLAIERFVLTPERVEAEVLLRIPTTKRTTYVLELAPVGTMRRFESITYDPGKPEAEPERHQVIERQGDSLRVETRGGRGEGVRTLAAPPATLPFIDMVHWPYEIALVRAKASNTTSVEQPLLTGARTAGFRIASIGADSMTITHPSRGTMRVKVDERGRLLGLDAGATTRKLIVTRQPWMPLEGYAERWAAMDAAGKSLGALSGRGETKATVAGASIVVDFGTPAKRGREIWGKLVPYGQVWRTGANQATHFTTDRDLLLGTGADTLAVPAGSYTLFSIPAADGGVLIVNTETGQTGTAYDPAHDLGRVRLSPQPIEDPVEVFNIAVTPEENGGAIRLQWDATQLVVPFIVR
jgi:hypothetical protein